MNINNWDDILESRAIEDVNRSEKNHKKNMINVKQELMLCFLLQDIKKYPRKHGNIVSTNDYVYGENIEFLQLFLLTILLINYILFVFAIIFN